MRIHNNEVNNISECNLLHDKINPPKRAKYLNRHYYSILHGCMNIRRGKAKFKNFHIILDSGCSSAVVMGRLVKILSPEKYASMLWNTQARNITINHKVKIDFNLPALSATNVVTWIFHVDDPAMGRYDMISGRDILT